MAAVAVSLLGSFEVRVDGALQSVAAVKDRALLAVLCLRPGIAHSREELAGLLWGDHGDAQARDSLKHATARLRATLGGSGLGLLVVDRQSIQAELADLWVDAVEFERLLADGSLDAVEAAVALYRGDLLEGLAVRAAGFEEWLATERRRLRDRIEMALAALMRGRLEAGNYDGAATAAERLVALDPFGEEAWRTLMRVHSARGDPARALQLYESMRDRLHRELGVRPGGETAELATVIREGDDRTERRASQPVAPPALPDRPSIAVLPFQNLSGDPAQDYFADGIVEEIITALSRMRWLFVIARNSSFTYKGVAVDVKEVGRDLGVRYVLEGSVRSVAGQVRITGHLIDAATGGHLWGGSIDGALEDIFKLQDEVTTRVVGAIAPELERAEIDRARRKPTENLGAYDYYLRGVAEVHKWKREANDEALRLFRKAIELDPDFGDAWGMAARCFSQRRASGWVTDRGAEIAEVRRLARRAAELGPEDAVALSTAGIGLAFAAGELDDGAALLDRALALCPNLAMAWLFRGWTSVWNGDPDAALPQLAHAMRLSPQDPQIAMMQAATAVAHFFAAHDDDAILWAQTAVRTQPENRIGTCILAAALASRGDLEDAGEALGRLRRLDPGLRLSNLHESFPVRRPEHLKRWVEALRMAGLSA